MIDVHASGDDESDVLDAGRELDERLPGTEEQLLAAEPLLRVMARVARTYDVAITVTVHPPVADEDDR